MRKKARGAAKDKPGTRWSAGVTRRSNALDVKPDVNLAVQEVKLVSLRVSGITRNSFGSAFEIMVTDTGDYRLIDAKGNPLSDWVRIHGGDTVTSWPRSRNSAMTASPALASMLSDLGRDSLG